MQRRSFQKDRGEARVLIEEKAVGEEFTIQAFCDGSTIVPTPAVQDHKRLLPGDEGPNTGGMGSYSDASGILPFMDRNDYEEAVSVLQRIVEAMKSEGRDYRGVIYGQFMLTGEGPKVIEINARWGDPEAMNILPLLKTDFVDICLAMVGEISSKRVDFEKKARFANMSCRKDTGQNQWREKGFMLMRLQSRRRGKVILCLCE